MKSLLGPHIDRILRRFLDPASRFDEHDAAERLSTISQIEAVMTRHRLERGCSSGEVERKDVS